MEKNNTKQAMLDTALELFSVQGFEAASVAQIADAVGIRKASVYSHFGSKPGALAFHRAVRKAQIKKQRKGKLYELSSYYQREY